MWRGAIDVLLDVDVANAEGRFRFALRGLERRPELVGRLDDPHAAAAAAGRGLDDHRVADLARDLEPLLLRIDRTVAAGQDRDARLPHRAARARLVAEQPDHLRRRADEPDVARVANLGEIRALGEEPVARVDRVGAGDFRGTDDGGDVQVARRARRRADADVFIGEPHVERVLVGLGVDGHGLDAELAARHDDAQCDLAAVGDQDLLEHGYFARIANSRSPYCTGWPFST